MIGPAEMSVGRGVIAAMETFTLVPRGPFSLAASIRFLEGFTPAASRGSAPGTDDVLELAFPVEGSWQTVGVLVRQDSASVTAEIVSRQAPSPGLVAEVRPQVERILSLDVDGSGFAAVGERDPVAGEIQRQYPGLRPVGFWSPYEAAAWTIIGHRIRITQAAGVKARMAKELGEPVSFGGRVVHAFPSPERLAQLGMFPGLAGRKPEWLRSVAQAALDGQLDAARLRAMPHEEAMADLKKLPGIGDFSAGLILLRGAGDPDAVPGQEPRLARAVARLRTARAGHAGAAAPDQRELEALPHLGHAAHADAAGIPDRRDHRPGPSRPAR